MQTKILITGGAGFIASMLAEKLAENANYHITIVDNLVTGSRDKVPRSKLGNIRFIKADVNVFEDISGVFYSHHFDYVFHYAALVGVKRTLDNPVRVLKDISGIRNILNLSKNMCVKRVYYASSSEVYGEPVEFPQHELTTPLNSRLPYAIVKNVGEAYLRSYQQEYGLEYTIFRFFNTYGPKQSNDFVISRFVSAATQNKDIPVYGDGSQTRTFCHISDNISATVRAFEENKFVNDVLNVGSNHETSILELAKLIIEKTGSNSKIVNLSPLKEGDMTRRQPSIEKMLELLGKPLKPLSEGLEEVIHAFGKK